MSDKPCVNRTCSALMSEDVGNGGIPIVSPALKSLYRDVEMLMYGVRDITGLNDPKTSSVT